MVGHPVARLKSDSFCLPAPTLALLLPSGATEIPPLRKDGRPCLTVFPDPNQTPQVLQPLLGSLIESLPGHLTCRCDSLFI